MLNIKIFKTNKTTLSLLMVVLSLLMFVNGHLSLVNGEKQKEKKKENIKQKPALSKTGKKFVNGHLSLVNGEKQKNKEKNLAEQYKQTLKDLQLLSTAVSDYMIDNETPPKAATIKELLEQDAGMGPTFAEFYLEQVPEEKIPYKDAWGNDFIYKADGRSYWLASGGSNGIFTGYKQYGVYLFSRKDIEGKDIILSNAGISYGPVTEKQMEHLFLFWTYQLFFAGLQ